MAKTRSLFIGNSFTARNDLPGLVAQLVAAAGKGELEHELISINGAPLRTHLNKGEAHKRMQASRFDYVVLQEQSTLPVKNSARTAENIRDFDTLIKETGAQTVLYMTWARQNAPETQVDLSQTYTSAESARPSCPQAWPGSVVLRTIPTSFSTTRTRATPTSPAPIWPPASFTRRSLSAGPDPSRI